MSVCRCRWWDVVCWE